jgi:hypothetical protein
MRGFRLLDADFRNRNRRHLRLHQNGLDRLHRFVGRYGRRHHIDDVQDMWQFLHGSRRQTAQQGGHESDFNDTHRSERHDTAAG